MNHDHGFDRSSVKLQCRSDRRESVLRAQLRVDSHCRKPVWLIGHAMRVLIQSGRAGLFRNAGRESFNRDLRQVTQVLVLYGATVQNASNPGL